jgi:opacity protein-like surface antigen
MARPPMTWIVGFTLIASATCATALADGTIFGLYNPLGVYVGAGIGRSSLNQIQFDQYVDDIQHIDGQPLGWNAVIGIRPIPFLGAEVEYIDFGNTHIGPGQSFLINTYTQQFLGGEAHDRAAAVFAVGYLPLPIPWLEPFGKLGVAQIYDHESYGIYNNGLFDGSVGVSQTTHPSGAAYGGGLQFHIEQLAIRAQYERISGSRSFGGWNNPALLSVGVNWTF